MASVLTLGLASIQFGEIASDGTPATTLAPLGLTYKDSCTMTSEDPEVTEHFAEESEDPILRKPRRGRVSFAFQIMDPDATVLQKLFGGTVTGTPKVWSSPTVSPLVEQTVKITPEQGLTILIARGSVTAKINAEFKKSGLFLIDVTVVPLTPKKAGVSPMTATDPA